MKLEDTDFEMLLHFIRTIGEKELHNDDIKSAISSIVNDFLPRMTNEQKKEIYKQFPHFFNSRIKKEAMDKDVPLYDYY